MSDLRVILTRSPELLAVLEDVNVPFVHIRPSGRYEFSKLGRNRTGASPIFGDVHRELCAVLTAVGDMTVFQEWSFRLFRGSEWSHSKRATVLIERLPASIVDRLPQSVLQGLKLAVKHDGCGVILGPPGSSKSSILAWLAFQLTDEPLLLISENPPVDIPGEHITHVFPPTHAAEERAMQRLIRVSPNVFWDRINGYDDLQSSLGFGSGRRRWFSVDFADAENAGFFFNALAERGIRPRWDAVLTMSLSVIGRPEVTNFATREAGTWNHHQGTDALSWIGHHSQPKPFALTPIAPSLSNLMRVEEPKFEVDLPPLFPASSFSTATDSHSPLPIPMEPVATAENVPEITRQYPRTYDSRLFSTVSPASPVSPVQEPTRPSGFNPVAERPKTGSHPTAERTPIQRDFLPDAHTKNAPNDVLRKILPMLRDDPTPPFNLEDLRITMSGEMNQNDLDSSKDDHTDSQPRNLLSYVDFEAVNDDDDDDYSSVSQVFEDNIASMFTDDVATSVAAAANYGVHPNWPQQQDFLPDPATSPTGRISDPSLLADISESSVDREDATEEVNLADKLRMMRERFQRKD